MFFGFSPAVTSWYTSSRVGSFCCSSAICFGVTCSKVGTAFLITDNFVIIHVLLFHDGTINILCSLLKVFGDLSTIEADP